MSTILGSTQLTMEQKNMELEQNQAISLENAGMGA